MGVEKEILMRVFTNESLIKKTVEQLRAEIATLTSIANTVKVKFLQEENSKLKIDVETAKRNLIELETRNGVKQVLIKNQIETQQVISSTSKLPQVKKQKKDKKATATIQDSPINVSRLDLRIGLVQDVQRHPDADTLYVLRVNCANPPEQRTVCSGLVAHIPMESLANRLVVLLCNLKPVKMRGVNSEAMVMCASATSDGGGYTVEVLNPPNGSQPGDRITCAGYEGVPDPVLNPKKKVWETVAPELGTDAERRACYKGVPLRVEGNGVIVADTLKNANVK